MSGAYFMSFFSTVSYDLKILQVLFEKMHSSECVPKGGKGNLHLKLNVLDVSTKKYTKN